MIAIVAVLQPHFCCSCGVNGAGGTRYGRHVHEHGSTTPLVPPTTRRRFVDFNAAECVIVRLPFFACCEDVCEIAVSFSRCFRALALLSSEKGHDFHPVSQSYRHGGCSWL
jgi:hypothetical protein